MLLFCDMENTFFQNFFNTNCGYETLSGMRNSNEYIEIRPNSFSERHIHLSKPKVRPTGPAYLKYATFENRLKSFDEWPCAIKQKPEELAAAGFFYNRKEDQTICFHCGGGLKDWGDHDKPWEQHARWFSRCSFLRSHKDQEFISDVCSKQEAVLTLEEAANIEIPVGDALTMAPIPTLVDVFGKCGIKIRPNSSRADVINKSKSGQAPVYLEYAPFEIRLKSFADWPCALKQKPGELAAVGFFYTGKGDQTICFHCGGGLKNWEDKDTPWGQHAKLFPNCDFLLLHQGQDFVAKQNSRAMNNLNITSTNQVLSPASHTVCREPLKPSLKFLSY